MLGAEDNEDDGQMKLEIDEDMTMLERVKIYCESNISVQRLVHVRELATCAEEIGAVEAVKHLVPILKIVINDPELAIRQVLAEQLVPFSKVLLAEPNTPCLTENGEPTTPYEAVVKDCVPLLCNLLNSGGFQETGGVTQVPEAASEALLELAGCLKPHDIGHTILTAVLCLAHDNDIEEHRVTATQLLGALAAVVGRDLCCQFVLPEIISLADDPVFRVRKAAALKLGSVCEATGAELSVQRLLPVYEVLSRDEIWGVRKACVESLAEVAAVMPLDVRIGKLVKLFQDFHGDGSRWVRIAACQALGPFLATLPSNAISAQLVALFAQLANPGNGSSADADISYYCAYNFPGVVQAIGANRWSELSDAFVTLVSQIQWKVRRTLAFSLHDLARILGKELAENELLSTFDIFLKDLDEVKVGVVQHLASFLSVLSEGTRVNYLPTLVEIRAETDNWRFRFLLATQLAEFGAIYPRQALIETVMPLALDLCTDPVAEVRLAAISQIGTLMALLVDPAAEEQTAIASFLRTICGMATMQSCYKRANFVMICSSLVRSLDALLVITHLVSPLHVLATDRVAIVRLSVAKLVREQLMANDAFSSLPQVIEMRDQLCHDVDRDVLIAAHGDPNYEPPKYRCKPDPVPSGWPRRDNSAVADLVNRLKNMELPSESEF